MCVFVVMVITAVLDPHFVALILKIKRGIQQSPGGTIQLSAWLGGGGGGEEGLKVTFLQHKELIWDGNISI